MNGFFPTFLWCTVSERHSVIPIENKMNKTQSQEQERSSGPIHVIPGSWQSLLCYVLGKSDARTGKCPVLLE